jgi:hypothetical protein
LRLCEKPLPLHPRRVALDASRERLALWALLLATFGLRAAGAGQPIVENYVGRQVPTAMVARNLDRGSGFLRPQLDTGPFPNYFLVEPPVYELAVVAFHRATGLALEPAGRLVSALATALAAWGLYGLARRREGVRVAMMAAAAFATFPITIRYGRAFQPDMMMLGTLLAGLRCWDEATTVRGRSLGWLLTATGLALKVVAAYALIPLVAVILRPRGGESGMLLRMRPPHPDPLPTGERGTERTARLQGGEGRRIGLGPGLIAFSTVIPAACWYAYAAGLLSTGSRASADNAAIWRQSLWPSALLRPETYGYAGRFLVVRGFTPIGFALAAWALARGRLDRLWSLWAASAGAALLALAGKLHHEYYWLALAPVAAVGSARSLVDLAARGAWGRRAAGMSAAVLAGLAAVQSASTWGTPPEWEALGVAAREIRARVPAGALVVAPEAVLYAADRRGCRLEIEGKAAARAAGEWGERLDPARASAPAAVALVALYERRGARYLADVGDPARGRLREALHEALRSRRVLVDRPGVLVVQLREAPHGDPP